MPLNPSLSRGARRAQRVYPIAGASITVEIFENDLARRPVYFFEKDFIYGN
jgi:hypothetical protein